MMLQTEENDMQSKNVNEIITERDKSGNVIALIVP